MYVCGMWRVVCICNMSENKFTQIIVSPCCLSNYYIFLYTVVTTHIHTIICSMVLMSILQVPSPTVYELLNLDDPITFYGLSPRLVATESLLVFICVVAVHRMFVSSICAHVLLGCF